VLEIIDSIIKASYNLYGFLQNGNYKMFKSVAENLVILLNEIHKISGALKEEEKALNLPAASASVSASLKRIISYSVPDPAKAMHKIEYELIPLAEEMKLNFYFWGTVYPDAAKMKQYYEHDMFSLFRNRYVEASEASGIYKYDLSICVLGYNKLEYTKKCLENILGFMPQNITHELILVNHGSTDDTKAYFESLKPNKQMDIAVNGGGWYSVFRITEGKYVLMVSNDVIVTKNAIENLYKCISSDDSIAWVVPTTTNVSNNQTIPCSYETEEGMHTFAAHNNISDPYRWEQRVRLCNPIDIMRMSSLLKIGYFSHFFCSDITAFPDDKLSLLIRRSGLKMMLAKDAFCHHFGSVTLKDEIKKKNEEEFYKSGRAAFKRVFGIDPWMQGNCYDYNLFTQLKIEKEGHVEILGISCGLGSNPLKVKELLSENSHNKDVVITNYTPNPNLMKDLSGVSDYVYLFDTWEALFKKRNKYDYIVFESLNLIQRYREIVPKLIFILKNNGLLMLQSSDEDLICWMKEEYRGSVTTINSVYNGFTWVIYEKKQEHKNSGSI